jgi:5-methylthioribose kinase
MSDLPPLLREMKLIGCGESPVLTALSGGVSSEIYRVDTARGPICVKRALAQLRVSADWKAPVERSQHEVDWLKLAAGIAPGAVPRVLADSAKHGMFAMEYLAPEAHPVWKAMLRDGDVNTDTAAAVGRLIGRIHAATAADAAVASRFATDAIFHALRLEPYLLATAKVHPDCAAALGTLAERTANTRLALVHGDVSPKNILVGANGPVLLDAECAWYGDPAFDPAFCLTHLLLKAVWRPQWRPAYLACFNAFRQAYLREVSWEQPEAIEQRTAQLLPGLLLARVDGKSPVEYISTENDKNYVRSRAIALLLHPPSCLAAVSAAWA